VLANCVLDYRHESDFISSNFVNKLLVRSKTYQVPGDNSSETTRHFLWASKGNAFLIYQMNLASSQQNSKSGLPNEKAFTLANGFNLPLQTKAFQSAQKPTQRTYFNRELINSLNVTNSQPEARTERAKASGRKGKYKPAWQRLSEKSTTKSRVCVLLDELKNYELANNFRACHSRFLTTTCGTHITERKATFYCGHRACVFCAEIRSRRMREKYLPKVTAFAADNVRLAPCHLVLTQKHYLGEVLSDSIKRLLANFRKLIRREFWKHHLSPGGVYAVEFTLGKDGCWHAHLHCLVFRQRFFNVKSFRREWKEVTNDSVNFKIDRVTDIKTGLFELVKYISKPLDAEKYKANHLKQVLDLKAQRLFSTFGTFRAFAASFEVPEVETAPEAVQTLDNGNCPHCSLPLFSLMLGIREQIELERFIAEQKSRKIPTPNARGKPT
jgi:hypothetical protein